MCKGSLIKYGSKYLHRQSLREQTVEKIQRWYCNHCRSVISSRKTTKKRQHFTNIFIQETVRDFIQGRSSYAVIKERKDVSIGTLSNWVHKFGSSCMSPVEISDALGLRTYNRWSGILILDGKYLNKRSLLLLAIDYGTLDIIAWLVCEAESEENYTKLVSLVEEAGYVIRAVVSDGEPSIIALTQPKKQRWLFKGTRTYPRPGIPPAKHQVPRLIGIVHQWCVIHAERELNQYTTKLPKEERKSIDILVHNILFANTIKQAEKWREKLLGETFNHLVIHTQIAGMITTRWNLLMAHHTVRVSGRKIPRDTNSIENVISYLNTRLKTMRRLRNFQSAEAITNLIVVNFRCKPLINTKNKLKRGKSPLELATGKKKKYDWMMLIKKPTP